MTVIPQRYESRKLGFKLLLKVDERHSSSSEKKTNKQKFYYIQKPQFKVSLDSILANDFM